MTCRKKIQQHHAIKGKGDMKRFFLFFLLLLTIIFFSSCISQNGQNNQLEQIKTPIWTKNDLEIIKMGEADLTGRNVTIYVKPPFYNGTMPLKITSMKNILLPNSIEPIIVHDFGDFINLFIYEKKENLQFLLIGVQTYPSPNSGKPNNPIAEAKISYVNEGKRIVEMEEFHYGTDGKLLFYSKSEIDPSECHKIKEKETKGKKIHDYYFILPVGFCGRDL